jgi:hypothetical protein
LVESFLRVDAGLDQSSGQFLQSIIGVMQLVGELCVAVLQGGGNLTTI